MTKNKKKRHVTIGFRQRPNVSTGIKKAAVDSVTRHNQPASTPLLMQWWRKNNGGGKAPGMYVPDWDVPGS